MHECEVCGMSCDCDGEDLVSAQPSHCVHLVGPDFCEDDDREPEDQ